MQTALQKLKENLKIQKEYYGREYPQFVNWIDELMELEKETIETAFLKGIECGVNNEYAFEDLHAKNYYTQTFKND